MRTSLIERRAEILIGLEPCDRLDAAEEILSMFDAWPSTRMDASKAKGVAVAYTDHLGDMPLWAIRAGIMDAQKRREAFPPSAGELLAICLGHSKVYSDEAKKISAVLNAEVYIPRPKHDLAAKKVVRDLASSLGKPFRPQDRRPDYRDNPKEAAEHRLAALNYIGEPVQMSDALVSRLAGRKS